MQKVLVTAFGTFDTVWQVHENTERQLCKIGVMQFEVSCCTKTKENFVVSPHHKF